MPVSARKIALRDRRVNVRESQAENAAFNWDLFDSSEYVRQNYAQPFDDDLKILEQVADHFRDYGPVGGAGIDMGAGANFYPTLSMLPFCDSVRLVEFSLSNRRWLTGQIEHYDPLWDRYWQVLAARDPLYAGLAPRERVRDSVRVQPGNILQFTQSRRYDIGTMFFVAESISEQMREYNLALRRFITALKPGAPFAIAFMQESPGYTISKIRFPAVPVTVVDVRHSLAQLVDEFEVQPIFSGHLLRDDYRGMILALGRARRARH